MTGRRAESSRERSGAPRRTAPLRSAFSGISRRASPPRRLIPRCCSGSPRRWNGRRRLPRRRPARRRSRSWRVFSWAAERPTRTGIEVSPFTKVTRPQRKRLLPRGDKRAYIYTPEQLRALYEILPAHSARVTRFAVHTGCRLREIFRLKWEVVDLEAGKLTVLAKYAKNGKNREVALGDVARSILEAVRPAEPDAQAAVFLGETGEPLKTIYTGFVSAVEKVWKPKSGAVRLPLPDERRPRFHDLRKTGATRVESVSSHAVAKAFLGHEDSDVTDSYLHASVDDVRVAVNRAARSIDGETPAGAIPFPVKETGAEMAVKMAPQAVAAGSEQ